MIDQSLRDLIVSTYQDAVRNALVDEELKQALKTHERVPAFLGNLTRELSAVPKITKEEVQQAVHGMTNVFLNACIQRANEMMLSDAEKSRIKTEIADAEQIKKGADELLDHGTISEETLHVLQKE